MTILLILLRLFPILKALNQNVLVVNQLAHLHSKLNSLSQHFASSPVQLIPVLADWGWAGLGWGYYSATERGSHHLNWLHDKK